MRWSLLPSTPRAPNIVEPPIDLIHGAVKISAQKVVCCLRALSEVLPAIGRMFHSIPIRLIGLALNIIPILTVIIIVVGVCGADHTHDDSRGSQRTYQDLRS